jgi:hypothetical protein
MDSSRFSHSFQVPDTAQMRGLHVVVISALILASSRRI